MDIKVRYKSIRALAAKLDPENADLDRLETENEDRKHLDRSNKAIWLRSIDNPEKSSVGGQIVSACPLIAAERLYEKTHEMATDEQVRAHKEKEDITRDANMRTDMKSNSKVNVINEITLSAETLAALASQQPQPPRKPRNDQQPAG